MKQMEEIQQKLHKHLDSIKLKQNEYQKVLSTRQQLDAQLNENSIVLEEMNTLKPCNTVYKMIGSVLIKQELDEAKHNVSKRIDYIKAELERQEKMLDEKGQKLSEERTAMTSLQQELQQLQVKKA